VADPATTNDMKIALTGIAADFTASLQRADIAVFIISTW
jgi:hypothetical protein